MSRVSTHYSGSGPTVQSITGFKSWEDLAGWEARYQLYFEEHVENFTELNEK